MGILYICPLQATCVLLQTPSKPERKMDEKSFKDRAARLSEVGKIIEKLPAEIRALSFHLLEEYILGDKASSPDANSGSGGAKKPKLNNTASRNEFLAAHSHDKPSDNVRLLIAALYREYGAEPFSVEELEVLAKDTGVTVPDRMDMTIKQAKRSNKGLFTASSRGFYKVTVHGEAYLKDVYGVTKGTKKKVNKDDAD